MKNQNKPKPAPVGPGALTIYNSRRDRFGNCAFAISYYDHTTERTVTATVDSASSARVSVFHLNGGTFDPQPKGQPRPVVVMEAEISIREFNRITKGWPHFGCDPAEIAGQIRAAIGPAPATNEQRFDIMRRVLIRMLDATESWGSEHRIGECLAYLCHAIAIGGHVDWSDENDNQADVIIPILRAEFPTSDPVWQYIIAGERGR